MEDITDEEFMVIMDYLNKHTSPSETQQIDERRTIDAIWDAKIRSVEQMRFKQRYAEARQALQPVFEQSVEEESRVVSLLRNTTARLSAAAVVLMLLGGYWGIQYLSKKDTVTILPANDSIHKHFDTPVKATAMLTQMAEDYINHPLKTSKIPKDFAQEVKGINDSATRLQTIRSIEALSQSNQVPSSPLPNEISYGSGNDSLSSVSLDSLDQITQKNACQQFILGVGYLKNKQPEKALKTLLSVQEPSLSQDIHWYKALTYLQLGQPQKARTELSFLTQSSYKTEVQKLLPMLPF